MATEHATEAVQLTTDIQTAVLDGLRTLSADKQREVLDFVEFLKQRAQPKQPFKTMRGLWKGLGIDISEEDIAPARREMWGNSPREFPVDEDS